jgi:hypothetical protein
VPVLVKEKSGKFFRSIRNGTPEQGQRIGAGEGIVSAAAAARRLTLRLLSSALSLVSRETIHDTRKHIVPRETRSITVTIRNQC